MNILFKYKYSILILLFVFAAFTGCSEKITDISRQGPELKVSVSPGISVDLSQASTFILTITGPGILRPIKTSLMFENGLLNCTVLVPSGPNRTFRIEGFDETGELIYSGQTIADIEPGVTAELSIDLYPRVPMVKLSPMYYYKPFGSSLAFKVNVYNMNAISSIDINISNSYESSEPGPYNSYWSADSVILNPDIADFNSLVWRFNEDESITLNINNRYANSILDESGCGKLATVYYRTYFNEGPPVYTFNPQITAIIDLDGNSLNTENIYREGAVAELFYYMEHRVGYWTMNWLSDDRNIVIDSSDNNLHGIASGTTMDEGAYGNARVFDGINDFIEVPDDDLLDINEGVTFLFWVNIPELSPELTDTAVIFSKMTQGGPVNYQFLVSGLTEERNCSFLFTYGESSNVEARQVCRANIEENIIGTGWRNIIFSYQFGDSSSAIFVFDYTRIYGEWIKGTGQIPPPLSDGSLTFGKQMDPERPLYFKGGLDDFDMYDVSLDYSDIRSIFFPQ